MSHRSSVVGRQSGATCHTVSDIYARLDAAYGGEHWHWMPEHATPIEIIVGAILVQHTTWQSAERALDALRAANLLDVNALLDVTDEALVQAIRISGTPTVKVRRLRAIAQTIVDAGGLDLLLALPQEELHARLIATHGIGSETGDAIALYAAAKRTFVIDSCTRRVFRRIGIGPERDGYEDWRAFFENALPHADTAMFRRYHAWIVLHAKARCRPRPLCGQCPLLDCCETGRSSITSPADVHPPAAARAARNAR